MKYRYSVIRFVPDPIRGEFVNVGVLVGSDESSEWELRAIENMKRARNLDDRGLLRLVWNELDDLGRKLDRFSEAVQLGQLGEVEETLSSEWLLKLAEESRNVVQFSSPAVIVSPDIEHALKILFQQFIVDPEAKQMPTFIRKNTALAAVRKAYIEAGLTNQPNVRVDEGTAVRGQHHSERFDFVVANGRAVQLTQTWSFQNPNQEELAEQVKAWAWTVQDIRSHGGKAEAKERQIDVPKDVDIGVIYIPPIKGGSDDAFNEALSAFGEIDINFAEIGNVKALASRASKRLLVK